MIIESAKFSQLDVPAQSVVSLSKLVTLPGERLPSRQFNSLNQQVQFLEREADGSRRATLAKIVLFFLSNPHWR